MFLSVDVNQGQNESREFSTGRSGVVVWKHGNGAVVMDGYEVSPNIVAFNKRNVANFHPLSLSTPIQSFLSDRQLL